MPLTEAAAAVIGAGLSAASSGASIFANAKLNRKTMRWNERMYALQRADALKDWAMQNEYNSPAAQMERLRAAGLNPHLVYGNGADAQGGIVRSTDVKGWNPTAPDFSGLGNVFNQYQSIRMMQQQTDNLQAQNDILRYQAEGLSLDNKRKALEYGFKLEDRPYDLQYKKGKVEQQDKQIQKILADMDLNTARYNIDRDKASVQMRKDEEAISNMIMQRVMMKQGYKMNQQQMDKVAVEIENLKTQGVILGLQQEMEQQLNKYNIRSNDGVLWKLSGLIFEKLFGNLW